MNEWSLEFKMQNKNTYTNIYKYKNFSTCILALQVHHAWTISTLDIYLRYTFVQYRLKISEIDIGQIIESFIK